MAIERSAAVICAWLATYFLHSTLLVLGAWIATRRVPSRLHGLAELVWRAALVLPAATTLAQQLSVSAIAPASAGFGALTYAPQALSASSVPGTVWIGAASLWMVGAFLGLARLFVMRRDLLRCIAERSPLPRLHAQDLQSLPGVRSANISLARGLSIPLALAREICLPAWMIDQMSAPELRAVVAHELAHVRRRDAWWRPMAAVIARVFFFQPLNWMAASRLRELSECICDDEAIAATSSSMSLATALAAVAKRATGHSARMALAPAMGARESLTVRRVTRILSHTRTRASRPVEISVARQALLVLVVAAVATLFAPRVILPALTFQRYTITGDDPAGRFTLTVEKGRVVGATIAGRALAPRQVIQRGAALELVDENARVLSLRMTPEGGIRWSPRQPVNPGI